MEKSLHSESQTGGGLPKDRLSKLAELPSLPTLVMAALQQINEHQNTTALAEKIAQDPPLVAKILRIANSSFYGRPREVGSIKDAIVLLGLNRVRELLLSVCFSNLLPILHKNFDPTVYWQHSMAVAECSRQMANQCGVLPEFAFTAGLLHDIGRLIIAFLFPETVIDITSDPSRSVIELERAILGFDHLEIGAQAAKKWNLPLEIQQVIEQHETPPTKASTKSLSLLVYAANFLMLENEQLEEVFETPHESIDLALTLLEIPKDMTSAWVKNARQCADQMIAVL